MLGVSVNLGLCSPDFVYIPICIFAIIIGKYDKHIYRKLLSMMFVKYNQYSLVTCIFKSLSSEAILLTSVENQF